MANPEQQGLKHIEARYPGELAQGAEMANPEQQGLKPQRQIGLSADTRCRNG